MTDATHPEGWKPQLGLLPPIPGRPVLMLRTLGVEPVALPIPPVEVHNIELDPDTDMLGNDVWGNCTFVAVERHRRIAAAVLGAKITWLTALQVINNYKACTGVKEPPGPGAVMQVVLEWTRKHPERWGGSKLLFFALTPHTELAMRESVSEFHSVITCEEIRAAQQYPATVWDLTPAEAKKPVLGGHATPGGTYTKLYDFVKTWGYMVEVTPSFFAGAIDQIFVLVWDFMWASLTYDRQVTLIADLENLTGKTWDGPAPIKPAPPPTEAEMKLLSKPVRLFDGSLPAMTAVTLPVAGHSGIPAGATGLAATIRVIEPLSRGWIYAGPVAGTPASIQGVSTLDFEAGVITDGFPIVGLSNGALTLWTTKPIKRLVIDTTGYLD
jgi:hypothetical protein